MGPLKRRRRRQQSQQQRSQRRPPKKQKQAAATLLSRTAGSQDESPGGAIHKFKGCGCNESGPADWLGGRQHFRRSAASSDIRMPSGARRDGGAREGSDERS